MLDSHKSMPHPKFDALVVGHPVVPPRFYLVAQPWMKSSCSKPAAILTPSKDFRNQHSARLIIHRRPSAIADRAPLMRDQRSHSVAGGRSEEHTSELQSRSELVCRLLLE